ncbi:MAG: hypothetical protein ACFFDP_11085 [Promethearchaeota archaeon]
MVSILLVCAPLVSTNHKQIEQPTVFYLETVDEEPIIHSVGVTVTYENQSMQIYLENRTDLGFDPFGNRFQFNNHWTTGDYYFLQQFNMLQDTNPISIDNGTHTWVSNFTTADSLEGCGRQAVTEEQLAGGEWNHTWWLKANDIGFQELGGSLTAATMDVKLYFDLITYEDRNELKLSVTIYLPTSGLPLDDSDNYTLKLLCENAIEDRSSSNESDYFWVDPTVTGNNATFPLSSGSTASEYTLEDEYIAVTDGVPSDTLYAGVSLVEDGSHFLQGEYNFTNLEWAHTTEVHLDPTLITYFVPKEAPTTTTPTTPSTTPAIPGFSIEAIIIGAFFALSYTLLRRRNRN